LARPKSQPHLSLIDAQGEVVRSFRHNLDFGFDIRRHAGSGEAEAELTFVGFTKSVSEYEWEDYSGLNLNGKIALIVDGDAPHDFPTEAMIRGARGVLWISSRSQIHLAGQDSTYLEEPTIPVFRIRPSIAQEILEREDISFEQLANPAGIQKNEQSGPGWFTRSLTGRVRVSVHVSQPRSVEFPVILGFLPGSDYNLSHELVVLFANYDTLGAEPEGTVYPGANHNATGIGVLLEIARTWQEQELKARRPVLFVAWGGGELTEPGTMQFLGSASNFRHLPNINPSNSIEPKLIFEMDRLGAGLDLLAIHQNSHRNLATMLKRAISESGGVVMDKVEYVSSGTDVRAITRVSKAAWISFAWGGPELPPDQDVLDHIDPEKLQAIGEPLLKILTRIVRENRYIN